MTAATPRAVLAPVEVLVGGTRVPADAIAEDPSTGELQVNTRPPVSDRELNAQLLAPGYLPASFTVDPSSDGTVHTVELTAGGRIIARVTPPDDGRYGLAIERFDGERDRYIATSGGQAGPGAVPAESSDGVHVYDGLAPGRYRLTEPRSGYQPGTQIQQNDLCNGFAIEAELTGVEVYSNGETGPACQASIECFGYLGINLPGQNSFGQVACQTGQGALEILFTSATESVLKVNAYTDQEGTFCVGQGSATPAQ